MSYKEKYTFTYFATAILMCVFIALFAGCGRKVDSSGNDPQSPLTKTHAKYLAGVIARSEGGQVRHISRSHFENSMGKVISRHGFYVVVSDFEGTAVNDIVVRQERGKTNIHQVISRNADALRTAGMNNTSPDAATTFEENYIGTVITQVYYREGSQ